MSPGLLGFQTKLLDGSSLPTYQKAFAFSPKDRNEASVSLGLNLRQPPRRDADERQVRVDLVDPVAVGGDQHEAKPQNVADLGRKPIWVPELARLLFWRGVVLSTFEHHPLAVGCLFTLEGELIAHETLCL